MKYGAIKFSHEWLDETYTTLWNRRGRAGETNEQ